MAHQLAAVIRDEDLQDLGKLEQDLVYGEASTKEVLAYLQKRPRMSTLDKVSANASAAARHDSMAVNASLVRQAADMIHRKCENNMYTCTHTPIPQFTHPSIPCTHSFSPAYAPAQPTVIVSDCTSI